MEGKESNSTKEMKCSYAERTRRKSGKGNKEKEYCGQIQKELGKEQKVRRAEVGERSVCIQP